MEDRKQLDFWRDQKNKIINNIRLLTQIKKEMNIQDPKKVLERHIKNMNEELQEAIEAYEFYLTEECKNENFI